VNDILRWAKEADLWMTSDERIAAVERFAALVRDDERKHFSNALGLIASRMEKEYGINSREVLLFKYYQNLFESHRKSANLLTSLMERNS
jgi:hypothetical protein